MHEYTRSEALRRHMYAVEVAMRAMAERAGEDPDAGGWSACSTTSTTSAFPTTPTRPTEEHPAEGVRILAARGSARATCGGPSSGHATYSGVPRDTPMARALFAVDELCGFLRRLRARAPLEEPRRPRGGQRQEEAEGQGLRARGEPRGRAAAAPRRSGVPLEEHIGFVLEALRPHERAIGLGGA